MKILIVYGTTEGQTRKISHFMEATLKDVGYEVTVADASETPPSPSAYDAVIIGASIHIHKYQSAVVHYINRHVEALNKMPGAFFSVCLAIASELEEEHKEARKITTEFLEHAGWRPDDNADCRSVKIYTIRFLQAPYNENDRKKRRSYYGHVQGL